MTDYPAEGPAPDSSSVKIALLRPYRFTGNDAVFDPPIGEVAMLHDSFMIF